MILLPIVPPEAATCANCGHTAREGAVTVQIAGVREDVCVGCLANMLDIATSTHVSRALRSWIGQRKRGKGA